MVAQGGICGYERNHEKGGMLAFDMDKELEFYIKHGYCPEEAGLTIQWAFEDWALGEMAKAMGNSRIIIIIEIVPWAGLRLGIRI